MIPRRHFLKTLAASGLLPLSLRAAESAGTRKVVRLGLIADLHKDVMAVACTVPYTGPVFTILELRPDDAVLTISACQSQWPQPGPDEIGYPPAGSPFTREMLYPGIRARKFAIPA